jgi:hypothetical protein
MENAGAERDFTWKRTDRRNGKARVSAKRAWGMVEMQSEGLRRLGARRKERFLASRGMMTKSQRRDKPSLRQEAFAT